MGNKDQHFSLQPITHNILQFQCPSKIGKYLMLCIKKKNYSSILKLYLRTVIFIVRVRQIHLKDPDCPTSGAQIQGDVFAVCRQSSPSGSTRDSRHPPSGAFQNRRPGGPGSRSPAGSRREQDRNTEGTRMNSLTEREQFQRLRVRDAIFKVYRG